MPFLATTALEDFWDKKAHTVFLGQWCLKKDLGSQNLPQSYEVMNFPWDDSDKISRAINYCDGIYEELLGDLSRSLNLIHDSAYDTKYWRIVVGPWLLHFIHALYDRYTCLNIALNRYPSLETTLLKKDSYIVPKDYFDFSVRYVDDLYNLQLYSSILKGMGYTFFEKNIPENLFKQSDMSIKRRLKTTVKNTAGLFFRKLGGKGKTLVFDTHLSNKHIFQLCKASGYKIWPAIFDGKYSNGSSRFQVKTQLRAGLMNIPKKAGLDTFKKILYSLIHSNIPVCHVEGYGYIKCRTDAFLKTKPKGVHSSFGWRSNETFKLFAAEASQMGVPLMGMQHGGASGVNAFSPGENHQVKVSDTYFSWGWKKPNVPNIKFLPEPSVQEWPENEVPDQENPSKGLYAGTIFSRYLHHFRHCPLGPQVWNYIQWQIRFFKKLSDLNRQRFIARVSPSDRWWGNKAILKEACPDLELDDFSMSFKEKVKGSRLIVIDNFQTTFLETMVLNKPVILFQNPDLWKTAPEIDEIVALLRSAGIFFHTPEEAARQVDKVMETPKLWWESSKIQSVRKIFLNYFARTSPDWVREWKTICY